MAALSGFRKLIGRPANALETDRLALRRHRRSDFGDCQAMWSDSDVMRYLGGRPFTREECWARLLRYAGHWDLLGFGFWAVIEKASGRFAGEIGFANFERDIEPSFDGAPEIGWVFMPWAQGRGYATEAARAVTAWGDAKFGSSRTVCIISPDNVPSLRVAEKSGYRQWGETDYKDSPVVMFERKPGR
ncbi:MAG TPA: GNAT family N-acetyltransferase [Rhizomicrobium sp.]|jgi:RimJ/RimL family protein N-acetyltransferase